ncbi:MAG: RDD family protein [Flavisolibacter sp.]
MHTETNIGDPTVHIFKEEDIFQPVTASRGQRFLNYVIDSALLQYGLAKLTTTIVVKLMVAIAPEAAYQIFAEDADPLNTFLAVYSIIIFNDLFYYTICEKAFRGYTLGKLVTGTRAIRLDGKELSFKDALLRTLCRLVPLEALSGFWTLWHDTWTKTTVIKAR